MKKNLIQLVDERNKSIKKINALVAIGTTEKRELTDPENVEFRALAKEIADKNEEIAAIQGENAIIEIRNGAAPKVEKKISLFKEINERMNDATKGAIMLSTSDKIVEERALNVSTAGEGAEVVSTQKLTILEPLRDALVLTQAGAQFVGGLVNDLSLPTYGGTTAMWKGETASAENGEGEMSDILFKPKRLTTYIDVSRQFLAQDSVQAEQMLLKDIVKSLAIKLQKTILGNGARSDTQPGGFFAAAPTIKGGVSWDNMVALETKVDSENAAVGSLKYITNAGGMGILKTTPKVANQPIYLVDKGEMNGYGVLSTNGVAKGLQAGSDEYGVVFGNWEDYVICQWGNVDLIIDNYTLAVDGKVRIVVNGFFDAAARREESFATASIKAAVAA